MKRTISGVITACVLAAPAFAHPGHDDAPHAHRSPIQLAQADAPAASGKTSGQGAYTFRVKHTSALLPAEALEVLVNAHGGFAVDRREGKGEVYFALPGAGIIQISADLSSSKMLFTSAAMKSENMHNTSIWHTDDGDSYLVFPGNGAGKVFTTSLDGALVHILEAPTSSHKFNVDAVNEYFASGESFVPTDVDVLNGLYYIATGYSALDYVLTASIDTQTWHTLAFGGKGTEPGQFGTGHGVTVAPSQDRIDVADRPHAEIDRFTPGGEYIDTVNLPEGAFPCDIDYAHGYALVGCLHGKDREKGAPIYLLKDDQVISTIMPKEDLGLENFQHIHNAVLTKFGDRLYIIAQAWNPGDFAILEQVVE